MDFRLLHGLVKLFGGLWFRYFRGASYCLIFPFYAVASGLHKAAEAKLNPKLLS